MRILIQEFFNFGAARILTRRQCCGETRELRASIADRTIDFPYLINERFIADTMLTGPFWVAADVRIG